MNLPISICLIFKDEEQNLPRLFSSIKDLIGKVEIIQVDTGSKDKSVEIQKKYVDKVYTYKWNNDFSQARNYSISKQTRDYILILDADDEFVSIDDFIKLASSKKLYDYNTYYFSIINILKNNKTTKFQQARLFRRLPNFKFFGRVHNQPYLNKPIKKTDISIKHYGYYDNNELQNKMKYRTIPLLLKQIKETPDKPNFFTQLAQAYNIVEDYDNQRYYAKKSLEIINKQIEQKTMKIQGPNSIIFPTVYYYSVACANLRQFMNQVSAIYSQLSLFPDYIDLHLLLYLIYKKAKYPQFQEYHYNVAKSIYNNKEKLNALMHLPYEIYLLDLVGGKNVQNNGKR